MKKICTFLLIITIGVIPALLFSQEKLFTIEDVTFGQRGELYAEYLSNLAWMGESDYFAYVNGKDVISGKAKSMDRDTIFSMDDLNSVLSKIEEDSLKYMPRLKWLGDNICMFRHNHRLFVYDFKLMQLREMNSYEDDAANIEIQDNTFAIAYTIENNVFIAIEGQQIQVTNEENKEVICGQSVHRNEFGINGGLFWSPKGSCLAFYRKDESMVSDFPIVDINKRIAEPDPIKYPMAGMTSEEVTLGIYNLAERKTIFVKTGEPADQYLTCVSWGPKEKYIYIAVLNRDQNHMKLNKYDAQTGAFIETLFEEQHETWVEPEHDMYFLKTKPELFVWFSERDGYQHLYLYDIEGNLIQQLTKGDWIVTGLQGSNPKDSKLFFTATKESPLNNDAYSLDLKNNKIVRISPKNGSNRAILNKNGKYFINIFSDTTMAREYMVVDTKGKILQKLLTDEDPLKDYKLGEMEIFTIKAENGDDLYCRLIKPVDFNSEKKYPVMIYVYGGPHAQLIRNTWLGAAGLMLNYYAQQGYVVFTLDNRGSANRGFSFENQVHRNMGTVEIDDQLKGVEYLKTLNYIDADRIGVQGWSYGGFMTISLMLKAPEIYKVGVAGGPVTDWKYYEIMYGERYMDTPEDNPEGYKYASTLNHAKNLSGDLLIIHGTADPVCVWQHSLDLIDQFIKDGVQVDYFVYPGHGHGVRGMDRLHLNQKIVKYFQDHL